MRTVVLLTTMLTGMPIHWNRLGNLMCDTHVCALYHIIMVNIIFGE